MAPTLNEEGVMPKESRAAVQICSADGLYVLASDRSIWRYSEFKDLNYWQPLEPLPADEDPPPLTETARHEKLCAALRQLDSIVERTTREVVNAARETVPDATSEEIVMALRTIGRPL
jgi:hypothetical protein